MGTPRKPAKKAGKAKPAPKKAAAKGKAPKRPARSPRQPVDLRVHLGAPSTYRPEYARQAANLSRKHALTDVELADFFGKSLRTIRNWQVAHPEFRKACESTDPVKVERVERSLFECAVGVTIEEDHISSYKGKITRTPMVKFIPGNPVAAMAWLTNKTKDWKHRQSVAVGGDADNPTPVGVVVVPAKEA